MTGEDTTWTTNRYRCRRCRTSWTLEWPEPAVDRCPECGKETEPTNTAALKSN